MSKYLPLNLFIRQALLYPLIAPFLPPIDKVEKDYAYAAGKLVGTLEAGEETLPNIDFCLVAPDLVRSAHSTRLMIFHVDPTLYPYGITIDSVEITLNVKAAYTLDFREFYIDGSGNLTFLATIEDVSTTSAEVFKKVSGGDLDHRDIEAGHYIGIWIPTTNIPYVAGKVCFTKNES